MNLPSLALVRISACVFFMACQGNPLLVRLAPDAGPWPDQAGPGGPPVPVATCEQGFHDGGDGACVPEYTCSAGYHNGGTGSCVANAGCPEDQLTNQDGACVPMAGVKWYPVAGLVGLADVASSADGRKLVAVGTGSIYTSSDYGATWTLRRSGLDKWVKVVSSSDGSKLLAAACDLGPGKPGSLYTSVDSGVTWTEHDLQRVWVALASSADGNTLMAAPEKGYFYISVDSGKTWTPQLEGDRWLAVVTSADGTKMFASGRTLFYSDSSGTTWTALTTLENWCLRAVRAASADGTKLIAFCVGDRGAGYLFTSTDSGQSWTERSGSDGWSEMASSADGAKLVVAYRQGLLQTSVDGGVTWKKRIDDQASWTGVASSADGARLVAVSDRLFLSSGPTP